jgi:hypothetical protein
MPHKITAVMSHFSRQRQRDGQMKNPRPTLTFIVKMSRSRNSNRRTLEASNLPHLLSVLGAPIVDAARVQKKLQQMVQFWKRRNLLQIKVLQAACVTA